MTDLVAVRKSHFGADYDRQHAGYEGLADLVHRGSRGREPDECVGAEVCTNTTASEIPLPSGSTTRPEICCAGTGARSSRAAHAGRRVCNSFCRYTGGMRSIAKTVAHLPAVLRGFRVRRCRDDCCSTRCIRLRPDGAGPTRRDRRTSPRRHSRGRIAAIEIVDAKLVVTDGEAMPLVVMGEQRVERTQRAVVRWCRAPAPCRAGIVRRDPAAVVDE